MSNLAVDDPASLSEDQRVDHILAIERRVLGKHDLTPDDDVTEHGGTSLSIVRILAETRAALSLSIDLRDLNGIVSARSLARAARTSTLPVEAS